MLARKINGDGAAERVPVDRNGCGRNTPLGYKICPGPVRVLIHQLPATAKISPRTRRNASDRRAMSRSPHSKADRLLRGFFPGLDQRRDKIRHVKQRLVTPASIARDTRSVRSPRLDTSPELPETDAV